VSQYSGACAEGERLWQEWSDACDTLALAMDHGEGLESAEEAEKKTREALNGHSVNHNCMPIVTGALWAGGRRE
jgi:hypothetical protein